MGSRRYGTVRDIDERVAYLRNQMHPQPPRRPGPPPNYALRRAVAATAALVVAVLAWNIVQTVTDDGDSIVASTTTEVPVTTTVPLEPPPECTLPEDAMPTLYARPEDWYRTLVDPIHALPETYEPPDLVPASQAHYSAQFQIRAIMVDDLNRLRNGIIEAGLTEVAVAAAYRSADEQRALHAAAVAELGAEAAARSVARARHSEHELGTAVDFRSLGAATVDAAFAETPTGQWLARHAWEYGFVPSHPDGATEVTCADPAPWHFRYLGPDLARRVHESGITLREYLWHWESTGTEPGVQPAAVQPALPTSTTVDAEAG